MKWLICRKFKVERMGLLYTSRQRRGICTRSSRETRICLGAFHLVLASKHLVLVCQDYVFHMSLLLLLLSLNQLTDCRLIAPGHRLSPSKLGSLFSTSPPPLFAAVWPQLMGSLRSGRLWSSLGYNSPRGMGSVK